MMRVTIANSKGGVGKTTLAVHAAEVLARAGRTVVLVDFDLSGNATDYLGVRSDSNPGVFGVLQGAARLEDCLIPLRPNYAILPSAPAPGIQDWLGAQIARERYLARVLDQLDAEYVIIDTGPSLTVLLVNALYAADSLWVPCTPNYLGISALGSILSQQAAVNSALDRNLALTAIVPSMCIHGTTETREAIQYLESNYPQHILMPSVPRTVRLSETAGLHKTLFDHAPEHPACRVFEQIVFRTLLPNLTQEAA
jgi:chromosome partitioning protein